MHVDNNIPRHVAIIMDGNGRWANNRGLSRTDGHRAGVNALKEIIRYCAEINIEHLTVYAFSTENWKRPVSEVSFLMNLLIEYLRSDLKQLDKNAVRIRVVGDISAFPDLVRREVEKAVSKTRSNTGLNLNVALNYGGRNEIINAAKMLAADVKEGLVTINGIDEKVFASYLYTRDIPDPDIIIRTSGELRISNFLLWQSAYSELWFDDCNWPDFTPEDLKRAIQDYSKRDRRFGGIDDAH